MFNKNKHAVRRLVRTLTVAMIALSVGAAWLTYPSAVEAQAGKKPPHIDILEDTDNTLQFLLDREFIWDLLSDFLKPDLIPFDAFVDHPLGPTPGFCRIAGPGPLEGTLQLSVKNQGGAASGLHVARITFFTSPESVFDIPLPATPILGVIGFSVDFPDGCFIPDCLFEYTVDADNSVDERNESNNSIDGFCLG